MEIVPNNGADSTQSADQLSEIHRPTLSAVARLADLNPALAEDVHNFMVVADCATLEEAKGTDPSLVQEARYWLSLKVRHAGDEAAADNEYRQFVEYRKTQARAESAVPAAKPTEAQAEDGQPAQAIGGVGNNDPGKGDAPPASPVPNKVFTMSTVQGGSVLGLGSVTTDAQPVVPPSGKKARAKKAPNLSKFDFLSDENVRLLEELGERYFICRGREPSVIDKDDLHPFSFSDFTDYMHEVYPGESWVPIKLADGTKEYMAVGEVFIKDWVHGRVSAKSAVLKPEPGEWGAVEQVAAARKSGVCNTWWWHKRFMPKPAAISLETAIEECGMVFEYLNFITSGSRGIGGDGNMHTTTEEIICWLSTIRKRPDIKMPRALYIPSPLEGAGKSYFAKMLKYTFGGKLVREMDGGMLDSKFDDHLQNCLFAVLHEVSFSRRGSDKGYQKLKHKISELDTINEGKGKAAKDACNYTNFTITGNDLRALPVAKGNRRFMIAHCQASQPLGDEFFAKLSTWFESGGAEKFVTLLMLWPDLPWWKPYGPALQTDGSEVVQNAARGDRAVAIEGMIGAWMPPFDKDIGEPAEMVGALSVYPDATVNSIGAVELGRVLSRLGHRKLGGNTSAGKSPWCWRNYDEWQRKPNNIETWTDHRLSGVKPTYPPGFRGERMPEKKGDATGGEA